MESKTKISSQDLLLKELIDSSIEVKKLLKETYSSNYYRSKLAKLKLDRIINDVLILRTVK